MDKHSLIYRFFSKHLRTCLGLSEANIPHAIVDEEVTIPPLTPEMRGPIFNYSFSIWGK